MQQLKIEVRARDERREDEVCAKWSTVERAERERQGECMRYFEKKARWEAEQRKSTRK